MPLTRRSCSTAWSVSTLATVPVPWNSLRPAVQLSLKFNVGTTVPFQERMQHSPIRLLHQWRHKRQGHNLHRWPPRPPFQAVPRQFPGQQDPRIPIRQRREMCSMKCWRPVRIMTTHVLPWYPPSRRTKQPPVPV